MGREGGLKLRWEGYERISRKCLRCNASFYVPPARAKTAKFCSRGCQGIYSRTAERRTAICAGCGNPFEAMKDHGVWPRSCSNACRVINAIPPRPKECPTCGGMFIAQMSSHASADGLRQYCSAKCAHEGVRKGEDIPCLNCGVLFYVPQGLVGNKCCSRKCASEFYIEERAPQWKGGEYIDTTSGQVRVRIDRSKAGGSAYLGQHRVIAAQYVGRILGRHEQILHINGITSDNRPDNLFICGTMAERMRRRMGSLPFPTKSNLRSYK